MGEAFLFLEELPESTMISFTSCKTSALETRVKLVIDRVVAASVCRLFAGRAMTMVYGTERLLLGADLKESS
jgi:hypothetical protein